MKNRKLLNRSFLLIIICILISTTISGCSTGKESMNTSNRELTMEEKLEDFEYMYNMLEESYPFFKVNERVNSVDWLGNKDKYIEKIRQTKNDEEFVEKLNEILSELNNDHTCLLSKEGYLANYKIFYEDKNPWIKILDDNKVKDRYNFTKEDIKLLEDGVYFKNMEPAFKTDIIIPNEVAYIRLNRMDGFRVEEDEEEILKFLKEIKNYPKLIIDIRGNGGGNPNYWEFNIVPPLIKEPLSVNYYMFARGSKYSQKFYKARFLKLKAVSKLDEDLVKQFPKEVKSDFKYYAIFNEKIKPKNTVDFNGKIYLLVDKNVFSAAEQFASFSKETGFATLVGEKTGGDGITENPIFFSLPNSGLVISFASVLGLNPDYTINEETKTTPDIEVNPMPHLDYEYDQCIKTVIED